MARASPSWSEKLRPVGKSFRNSKRCALTWPNPNRAQKSLREEIQHHEQEAARWQARIAEADANREQLAALQKPYNELLSKHASLAETQRELQQDLSSLARLMGAPSHATATAGLSDAPSSSTAPRERDSA